MKGRSVELLAIRTLQCSVGGAIWGLTWHQTNLTLYQLPIHSYLHTQLTPSLTTFPPTGRNTPVHLKLHTEYDTCTFVIHVHCVGMCINITL